MNLNVNGVDGMNRYGDNVDILRTLAESTALSQNDALFHDESSVDTIIGEPSNYLMTGDEAGISMNSPKLGGIGTDFLSMSGITKDPFLSVGADIGEVDGGISTDYLLSDEG